jgi:hypothetical protein
MKCVESTSESKSIAHGEKSIVWLNENCEFFLLFPKNLNFHVHIVRINHHLSVSAPSASIVGINHPPPMSAASASIDHPFHVRSIAPIIPLSCPQQSRQSSAPIITYSLSAPSTVNVKNHLRPCLTSV